MKKTKKAIIMLLVAVLVISLLPLGAFAAPDTGNIVFEQDPSDLAGHKRHQYIDGARVVNYAYASGGQLWAAYNVINNPTGDDWDYGVTATRSDWNTWAQWAAIYSGSGKTFQDTVTYNNGGTYNSGITQATRAGLTFADMQTTYAILVTAAYPFSNTWQTYGITAEQAQYATNVAIQRLGWLWQYGAEATTSVGTGYNPMPGFDKVAEYCWYLEQTARKFFNDEDPRSLSITPKKSNMGTSSDGQYFEQDVTIAIRTDTGLNPDGFKKVFKITDSDFPTGTIFKAATGAVVAVGTWNNLPNSGSGKITALVPATAANANKTFTLKAITRTIYTDGAAEVWQVNDSNETGFAIVMDENEWPPPDSKYADSPKATAKMTTPNVGYLEVLVTGEDADAAKLAGVEVGLYKKDGTLVEKKTTGADGKATFSVTSGSYYAQEIKVNNPYVITTTPTKTVAIVAGSTQKVTIPTVKAKGTITVENQDAETGTTPQGDATLNGGKWDIINAAGTKVATVTALPDSRSATSITLPLGEYTIVQTGVPTGYLAPDNPAATASLVWKDQNTAIVTDEKIVPLQVIKGTLSMTKFTRKNPDGTPLEDGIMNPLSGAVFDISLKSSGETKDTQTTNDNGAWTSVSLPYGTYTVTETQGVEGFDLVPAYDRFITENAKGYYVIAEDAVIESIVRVEKVDAQTGNTIPVAGTTFEVLDSDKNVMSFDILYPNPQTISTFVTDTSGTITLPEKLEYGTYYLRESIAPSGYLLNGEDVAFTVDDSDITVAKLPDNPAMGTISISKTTDGTVLGGKTGQQLTGTDGEKAIYEAVPLEGAVFDVIAADNIVTPDGTVRANKGDVVDTITTDADGYTITKPLYLGSYVVKETAVPDGYILDLTEYPVMLEYADQNTPVVNEELQVENIWRKVNLEFTKTAETSDGNFEEAAGFKFGVYAADDIKNAAGNTVITANTLIASAVSGDKGIVSFADLPNVNMYVQEIEAKSGYKLDATKYPVKTIAPEQSDKFIVGVINDGKAIQNHLISTDAPELVVNKTVSNAAPVKGETVTWTITVSNNGKAAANDVTVTDERLKGISPFNASGEYIIGTLAAGESKTITASEKVTADAGTTEKNIAVATGKDPNGNDLPKTEDDADYTVGKDGGLVIEKTVSNASPVKGETVTWTIKVTNNSKTDASDVTVTDERLKGISPFNASGEYVIGNLKAGESKTITVSEKVTADVGTTEKNIAVATGKDPNGNDLPKTKDDADYTVAQDGGLIIEKTVDNPNPVKGDTVKWTIKVTNSGKTDANSVVITDENLKGISPFDSNGKYTVGNLKAGESKTITASQKVTAETGATVKNIAVVSGKDPDGNDLPQKQSEAQYTVADNTPVFKIVKVDNQGNKLAGAEFTMYNYTSGAVYKTVTSGNDGVAAFSGMPEGKYLVKETKAPSGYKASDKSETVTIDANWKNTDAKATVEFVNTKIGKTGYAGQNTLPFIFIAIGAAAAAIFFVFKCKRKKQINNEKSL